MNRRRALGALAAGAAASVDPVRAQGRVKRVAILWVRLDTPSTPEERKEYESRFSAQGFRAGENLEVLWFETVYRRGSGPTLDENVAAMVRAKPDCIIAGEDAAVRLKKLTSTIPVVTNISEMDPVDLGLARSLVRPGGNFTGLHGNAYDVHLRRMAILKKLVPGLSQVAWIAFGAQLFWFPLFEKAARAAGLEVRKIVPTVPEAPRFERVRGEVAQLRANGCLAAHFHSGVAPLVEAVTEGALRARVAISYGGPPELASTEGVLFLLEVLMSGRGYENDKRLVPIASRVLRGERPGEIPFEGPVGTRFILNRKTAARIGVAIPPDILLLANDVVG